MYRYEEYVKKLLKKGSDEIYCLNVAKLNKALISILKTELLNYTENSNIEYLLEVPDIISKTITDYLIKLHYKELYDINNILTTIKFTNKTEENSIINKLNKKISDILENTVNIKKIFDQDKYEYIENLIYNVKYISEIKKICSRYPYLINMSNDEHEPIIYKLINTYITSVNEKNTDNIIYFGKVIETIVSTTNIDKCTLKNINDKLFNNMNTENRFHILDLIFQINGISEQDRKYINKKFNIEEDFSDEVKKESNEIYLNFNKVEGDTNPVKIYTFDGEGAKEIDDGISISYKDGIYHLGVHIADPTSYIPYNSAIMNEAKKRTTSIYFGNECIPMYPLNLSGDTMSLNEGKKTYAMSYYFDIDKYTGELINFEVKNEIIEITKNLTYTYLDDILKHGSENFVFTKNMNHLQELSKILESKYDDSMVISEFNYTDWTRATKIIANAMIYTNQNIARLFDTMELPFIYRNHRLDTKNIEELSRIQSNIAESNKRDDFIKNIEQVKKLLPRAYYSNVNQGHYGLGIDYYSHATSPLRRLSDNLVNICIKRFLLNEYTSEDIKIMNEEIEKICELINNKRVSIDIYSNYREKKLLKK